MATKEEMSVCKMRSALHFNVESESERTTICCERGAQQRTVVTGDRPVTESTWMNKHKVPFLNFTHPCSSFNMHASHRASRHAATS